MRYLERKKKEKKNSNRANPEMQVLFKSLLYHIVCCPLAKSNNMVSPKSLWEGATEGVYKKKYEQHGTLQQSYTTAEKKPGSL